MNREKEFQYIQSLALFVAIIAVGIVMWQMFAPYFFALFWAAILASIFYPVYTRLSTVIHKKQIASFVTVCIAIVILLIPLSALVGVLANEAVTVVSWIRDPQTAVNAQALLDRAQAYPYVADMVQQADVAEKLKDASSRIAGWTVDAVTASTKNVLDLMAWTFVLLYSFYYFLIDGKRWLKRFMHLLPLGDDNEEKLYEQFASTARATLKGTILIGVIQGILGGLLLWAVGAEAAAFWALVITIFSIIPAVGPPTVLLPFAIYYAVTGQWVIMAVVLVGLGFLSTLDNILRPPLVGRDLQMHPVLILLATIGGITVFGLTGVVIGPMVTAFFFSLMKIYEKKYRHQLENEG